MKQNGSAITIVQSSGIVDDLQHNNTDSQSRMAPGISKEDENLGVWCMRKLTEDMLSMVICFLSITLS